MSTHSKIEWTDATWNPLRGCTKISPGCKHCYAETFAERFRGVKGHPYERGFDLRLVPEKLLEPLTWATARFIFVNSMSDLFHPDVPDEYIVAVARVMLKTNWHTYQVLTKRAERQRHLLNTKLRFAANADHIWWGVSVEDQRYGVPRVFELKKAAVAGRRMNRTVDIYPGDFNKNIVKLLKSRPIADTEPVFCLLDQRMFECHWSTVKLLAEYKSPGFNKFEQFYFLAFHWLKRSIFGVKKNMEKIEYWWGRDDWELLKTKSREDILSEMLNRFHSELGYKHVCPYPIYERRGGGNIMYYMIHCTDHDEAPKLMLRAYNTALRRKGNQLKMFE